MAVEAYPLSWPQGWKRTANRVRSQFKTGFGKARKQLFDELGRMGATSIVLSTAIPLRNDGMPRANMRPDGNDTGVAVYFQREKRPMVFACDKYVESCDNIYAIAKTIEAMRGIERWGASDMMERAFAGFKALAAEVGRDDDPWAVLSMPPMGGLLNRADAEALIKAQHRALSMAAHPDRGGSADQMSRINVARDRAMAMLANEVSHA